MPHKTVNVALEAADPHKLTIPDVGVSGTSTITWVELGVAITRIGFGTDGEEDVPVEGATAPSAANDWTLTFPNPTSQVLWPYVIFFPGGRHDPEIDNVG
jgi:hypothetical protein